MKQFIGVFATLAVLAGVVALQLPAPVLSSRWPDCQKGKYCGTPEPGFQCPPCYYWEPCGPKCGCRPIPSCKP
jgi:hypothetical protein